MQCFSTCVLKEISKCVTKIYKKPQLYSNLNISEEISKKNALKLYNVSNQKILETLHYKLSNFQSFKSVSGKLHLLLTFFIEIHLIFDNFSSKFKFNTSNFNPQNSSKEAFKILTTFPLFLFNRTQIYSDPPPPRKLTLNVKILKSHRKLKIDKVLKINSAELKVNVCTTLLCFWGFSLLETTRQENRLKQVNIIQIRFALLQPPYLY